jgi:hypothetical protein
VKYLALSGTLAVYVDDQIGYWLKQVSVCHFDHPLEEIEKLLKKMHTSALGF